MKDILLKILKWKVKKLAELTLWRYEPAIIGVTGSVGKTSTKRAIAAVVAHERTVRVSHGNFNNELGLPLTILGDWEKIEGIFFWPEVILGAILRLIIKSEYPEVLVLEYGVDHPGDMRYLLEIARPNISVITAVGDIPVHVEFFNGPEDVAREKGKIIESLPVAGYAILNFDDETVMSLKEKTRGRVLTYGFQKGAMVHIASFENRVESDLASQPGSSRGERLSRPVGVSFKLEYGHSFVPVRLDGVFGKVHAYAAAAAANVGLILGMNLVTISDALRHYEPAPHRMNLVPGVKYTYIIDDAYNASPLAMHAALDTLKDLPGKRKVAVLGDMLEIGKYTLEAHEHVGRLAGKFVDLLVTVGPRAKFIGEAAIEAGLSKKKIMSFENSEDAAHAAKDLIKRGDLILVKGSHSIQLEKVVNELKAI
ncbi:MAG: UDP-N-acetylmuramoyl-tripeptide--D-alanyl-D-alanine ligase [bacterium]|nr:UDP-N-acetylmuramoyl-tripeptide--D-alanyl-D-alanine ligase [bacterium]